MTREEAIEILSRPKLMKGVPAEILTAHTMAIQALENIGHLKDRPCDVCEFRKENGCCKWDCVFD